MDDVLAMTGDCAASFHTGVVLASVEQNPVPRLVRPNAARSRPSKGFERVPSNLATARDPCWDRRSAVSTASMRRISRASSNRYSYSTQTLHNDAQSARTAQTDRVDTAKPITLPASEIGPSPGIRAGSTRLY
jgi:hypothetical protein